MPEKRSTRERLIHLLDETEGATLADLRRRTGLSRSTIRRHLGHMARAGLVQSRLLRGVPGRPPRLFSLSSSQPAAPYGEIMRGLYARLARKDSGEIDGRYEEMARRVAARLPEIRHHMDVGDRLHAAGRTLFGPVEFGSLDSNAGGYRLSISECPLGGLALECRDPCCLTRVLLSEMVGQEVEQSEWISRGDPRCSFEVRVP